jgi:hypothetical protein
MASESKSALDDSPDDLGAYNAVLGGYEVQALCNCPHALLALHPSRILDEAEASAVFKSLCCKECGDSTDTWICTQ